MDSRHLLIFNFLHTAIRLNTAQLSCFFHISVLLYSFQSKWFSTGFLKGRHLFVLMTADAGLPVSSLNYDAILYYSGHALCMGYMKSITLCLPLFLIDKILNLIVISYVTLLTASLFLVVVIFSCCECFSYHSFSS